MVIGVGVFKLQHKLPHFPGVHVKVAFTREEIKEKIRNLKFVVEKLGNLKFVVDCMGVKVYRFLYIVDLIC